MNGILGAIRRRINVGRRAADRVARRNRKAAANEHRYRQFPNHDCSFRWVCGTIMAVATAVCLAAVQQRWVPLIAFSVQFATEFTSRAAPRTVLQAASTSAAPISATVVTFWNIVCPPGLMD